MLSAEILTLLAEQAQSDSVEVSWWLRFGVIVYGVLLVAAFMVYAQTKHRRPWSVVWALLIAFVPIAGAVVYFIAQTMRYRRTGATHTKGRAERMAPEEYQGKPREKDDDDAEPGPTPGASGGSPTPPRPPA